MIQVFDFYGDAQPETDVLNSGLFKIDSAWAGPANAQYEAVIIGASEDLINLTPRAVLPDGAKVGVNTVFFMHTNPAVKDNAEVVRNVDGRRGQKHKINEGSVRLGGGSKIGEGGPVDQTWITGTMPDGGKIRSQIAWSGLYSSDVVLSPTFEIRRVGGTTPPSSGGGAVDAAAIAREVVRHLAITVQAV